MAKLEGDSPIGAGLPQETRLLLTVARILRARLPELAVAYQDEDMAALNEALAPFSAIAAAPVNEQSPT